MRARVPNHPRTTFHTASSPTVTLSVSGLRSVGWSTVRGSNIGHFGALLGSKWSLSDLLPGSLLLSVTVGLETVWKVPIGLDLEHSESGLAIEALHMPVALPAGIRQRLLGPRVANGARTHANGSSAELRP